jgi:hypothetical protein
MMISPMLMPIRKTICFSWETPALRHQAAIANHIRSQNRCEPALHGSPPSSCRQSDAAVTTTQCAMRKT